MKNLNKVSACLLLMFAVSAIFCQNSGAQDPYRSSRVSQPGWYPYVIARGNDRDVIENTPIELRPYRPMHFYGNTVRRSYYRGNPTPQPANFNRGNRLPFFRR